jgi:hypothetical protein
LFLILVKVVVVVSEATFENLGRRESSARFAVATQ